MLLDDNTNVRVVRRTAAPGGWLAIAFALCCCCTVVLVGVALLVGFAFTGNGDGSSALQRTRTNTAHQQQHRAHGRFRPLQELTQCSGFLDLPNSVQTQVGPECTTTGLVGRCLGTAACGGEFFEADRLSTEDGMGFECTVAQSVCLGPDFDAVCTCSSTRTTCRRNIVQTGTETAATFACVEPRVCTSFDDLNGNAQPAIVNAQCNEFGTQIDGLCRSPNGQCVVSVETVGALANDTTPAGQITCTPIAACTATEQPCSCFASACVRCQGGVNCEDIDNQVQFQCVAASQVPGGASRTGAPLLLAGGLVALTWAQL